MDTPKRIWAISILILFAGLTARASQPADATFERMNNVALFAFGGVGFTGQISQGEKDFLAILSRPSAMADFERLFLEGNPQARAYALSASAPSMKIGLRNSRGHCVTHRIRCGRQGDGMISRHTMGVIPGVLKLGCTARAVLRMHTRVLGAALPLRL
jgi:hypothetical protein